MNKHYWINSDGTIGYRLGETDLPIGKPIECFPEAQITWLKARLKLLDENSTPEFTVNKQLPLRKFVIVRKENK